jgi:2'-5' RNA ligase
MEMESALLILAPKPVQAFAYPLREEYDKKSFAKVPAHITLFYPFVPAALAEEEGEKLEAICAKFSPFEVTLDRYLVLDDAVTLAPADPAPIQALYRALAAAYPYYARPDYQPHLTLARASDPGAVPLPEAPAFSFRVDKLHLYVGLPDDVAPFIPRLTLPLG